MANKTLPASTGYFNKRMLDILEKGESKAKPAVKSTTAKSTSKATAKAPAKGKK